MELSRLTDKKISFYQKSKKKHYSMKHILYVNYLNLHIVSVEKIQGHVIITIVNLHKYHIL